MTRPDAAALPFLVKMSEYFTGDNPFGDSFLFQQTGSRYTCNPPVLDTDEDWICWVAASETYDRENDAELDKFLSQAGFETSGNQAQYPDCMSYRNGDVNIIVIYDIELYRNWVKATEICKYLNLMDKADRKTVHRICCDESL